MDKIRKELRIETTTERAFRMFVHELRLWWPKEYTWSQGQLKEIRIDAKPDGLCTEIGPYGFRCDWGRVTELSENKKIMLKWQIGPKREPVPDPEKASEIEVFFKSGDGFTTVELEHRNFQNHGEEGTAYCNMMNGTLGWDFILNAYKSHCEKMSA